MIQPPGPPAVSRPALRRGPLPPALRRPRARGAAAVLALVLLLTPRTAGAQPLPAPPVRYDRDLLPASFHKERRRAVLEALPEDAVAVVFAGPERLRSNDTYFEYRQDSDFYYLTGSLEPGSVLLLAPGGMEVEGGRVRELLFVPPRDPGEEIWTGRRFGAEGAEEELGVARALENTRFSEVAGSILGDPDRRIYHEDLPVGVPEGSALASQLRVLRRATSEEGSPGRADARALRGLLTELREIKTAEEIRLLQEAVDITVQAHRAVLEAVEPGWAEYEIEALAEYVFKREGAEGPGFNSIVGSGENSVILHYETNRRVTEPGDVVVMDIGAEVRGYSADVTRTFPVSGRFTREQRALYDLVLEAQEAAIEAARAGASFRAPGRAAAEVLARGMARLGLVRGPDDLQGLRRFFMHGTSHYLGLDVHDVGRYGRLEPGMVITVEPGLYVAPARDVDSRWWNIGIRIEDDVLVTEEGPRVLSAGAPKDADAIEKLMAGS